VVPFQEVLITVTAAVTSRLMTNKMQRKNILRNSQPNSLRFFKCNCITPTVLAIVMEGYRGCGAPVQYGQNKPL
jgi:hypothetical protein